MIQSIKSFFAGIRNAWFTIKIERECYNRLAPQVHREKDYGYPFHSREGLREAMMQEAQTLKKHLMRIEQQAGQMGEAQGEGFRYIMYRNLNREIVRYAQLADDSVLPQTCDPKFVAIRAV